jgi:hypothetical protein
MEGSRGEELIARLRVSQASRGLDPQRLAKKRARWYAFSELEPMLRSVSHGGAPADPLPPRLRRLFCTAACRRIWHLMPDECRRNVEATEADADRGVSREEQNAGWERLRSDLSGLPRPLLASLSAAVAGCGGTSRAVVQAVRDAGGDPAEEERQHTDLLRDILGEWFDPVAFFPEWRTGTAVALARTMYESRDFSAMPILADALQDAGCDSEAVLAHCRAANQAHVRGCWILDSVLGLR